MTTARNLVLIVSPIAIPTVVPPIAVIAIAMVLIMLPVGFSAVVTAAAVLITVRRHNAAAEQRYRSGKHHKNGFHKSS